MFFHIRAFRRSECKAGKKTKTKHNYLTALRASENSECYES